MPLLSGSHFRLTPMLAKRVLASCGLMVSFLLSVICLMLPGLGLSSPAEQKHFCETPRIKARLLTDSNQITFGEPFRAGVEFTMQPGWHIYWKHPGNTGLPTLLTWPETGPLAITGETRYPLPLVVDSSQETLSYGYKEQVLLFNQVMLVEELPVSDQVKLSVRADWLACKETCIKENCSLTLSLTVGRNKIASEDRARFEEFQQKSPLSIEENEESPFQAQMIDMKIQGSEIWITWLVRGDGGEVDFIPYWPKSCKILPAFKRETQEGTYITSRAEGIHCLSFVGGLAQVGGKIIPVQGKLPTAGIDSIKAKGSPEGQQKPGSIRRATSGVSGLELPETADTTRTRSDFFWMLLFVFLGGMLLNVMPCVIPVVILKIHHLLREGQRLGSSNQQRGLFLLNGLAYTGGVLLCFLVLGILAAIFKLSGNAVGWGFHFQSPYFIIGMCILMFIMGLGMLDLFSLKAFSGDDRRNVLRQILRPGLGQSFITGLIVTILGTPCTAPFIAPAMGFALSGSVAVILLFFITAGLGLAFPFLFLAVWTGWVNMLPKRWDSPVWNNFSRALGFLLIGTSIWLLEVLANQIGINGMVRVLWFLLGTGIVAWLLGLFFKPEPGQLQAMQEHYPPRTRVKIILIAVVCLIFLGAITLNLDDYQQQETTKVSAAFPEESGKNLIKWQSFDEQELNRLNQNGKTIFIDFTAQWCLNCKVNEYAIIETEEIAAAFEKNGVTAMKADYTLYQRNILKWLNAFGRGGVPMYLVIPPCGVLKDVKPLPEILTSNILLEAIQKAGPSRQSCESINQ